MSFVAAMLLGMAYVLPPGPVTVETVRHSTHGGLRSALAVQLGAVVGDLLCALAVMAGLGAFLQHEHTRFGLGLLGAALLIYLGLSAMLDGLRTRHAAQVATTRSVRPHFYGHHVLVGCGLSLGNPFALVFWLSISSTSMFSSAAALGGFFLGSLCASILTALAVGQLHRARVYRVTCWLWSSCGGLLMLLGCQLGYATLVA